MTVNVNRTVTPAVRDNNAFPAAVYAAKTPDETLAELHSDMLGLDEIDALDRLIEHQENVVAHDKAPPAFIQFITDHRNDGFSECGTAFLAGIPDQQSRRSPEITGKNHCHSTPA